jgi:hypothetical protein
MKRIIGIILLLALTNVVCAETAPDEEWSKTFGGIDDDRAYSVQQTSDGGYIITGITDSYGAGSRDVWLVKTDSDGNKQWDKTFGGTNIDDASSVQQTSDGGYILAGYTGSYGAGGFDFWLVKTDSEGNKEWNRTFGETVRDEAYSVRQTSDGGYILTGFTESYGYDFWILKTDSDGNKQWNAIFGGISWDVAHSVQQTSDGGYILAGYTGSYGAGFTDAWLVKTDSSGNKVWDNTFGGANTDWADSVQQTSDGGYILAGHTMSYGAGNGDFWLVKTDSDGNKQWDKTFGGTGRDEAYSVQQTSDDGYILAGFTESYGAGFTDAWLVKTDSEGNKVWDKTLGGANNDRADSVQQTSDGGYILAGNTMSYGAGNRDFWLIKVGGTPTPTPAITPTPAPAVTVLDCSPSPVHGGEDLYVKVSWANIPADWKLTVSLEKTEWDKARLADDVSKIVSGNGVDIFKLKVYPTTETYAYAKVWACFYEGTEWISVYDNKDIVIIPEPTPAPTSHPTFIATPTPILTPEDTSSPAISILNPIIIEYNNNGLLEEGEKVTITYGANDPSGVTSIKILLDGAMLESQNQAGTYTVTTNALTMGKHTIRVEATDSKSNTGFEELQITVERTGPSVYFGTTRTTIKKGEDAIFTLSAVNPIGNPPMTVQLILKPPTGVSVTSSSFAKAGSGIYTCTQTIESGDNVRSIEVRLTGNEVGTHEIESEVYYQFEGIPKSPTRYETLMLVVDDPDSTPLTPTPKPSPGFAAVIAITGLFAAYLRRRRI